MVEFLELLFFFELLEFLIFGGFFRLGWFCCYIFFGGFGDVVFFVVNGFIVLVNGGLNFKFSFWKLVWYLDCVDVVLVIYFGVDSFFGFNSLLWCKLVECFEVVVGGGFWDDRLCRFIFFNLGVVFFNVCEVVLWLVCGEDEVELVLSFLV